MNTKTQVKLIKFYKRYRVSIRNKRSVLGFLRAFMPEIIYRTTKLEGESVTRKLVRSLFQ